MNRKAKLEKALVFEKLREQRDKCLEHVSFDVDSIIAKQNSKQHDLEEMGE